MRRYKVRDGSAIWWLMILLAAYGVRCFTWLAYAALK